MVRPLHIFLRLGTPTLAALCAAGAAPWWLVLVPVYPMWWSTVVSTREAKRRRRFIRRAERPMSFEEAAAERKFWFADAALLEAEAEADRAEAFAELAAARRVEWRLADGLPMTDDQFPIRAK